ncbi:DNA topoisomerase IV, alpha subunit [Aaosphaeria arxii CBS 175.79]|uniref:DNA topoisomerase (ATP-hydrolyzing) n=1 Tax=Aaosphaeria arxii CBS 175.79 TaxID=1450172 RepID=A0A6A5Y6H1_9PLEO|nr:DNA topoisomerase IV, alpha subunit [Aaosphaeria arxii CBS 175.79]KAF2021165.1 DNA topoisomerase IV, alpha subunit [Aaosphaeria arxii CBS 175.79]
MMDTGFAEDILFQCSSSTDNVISESDLLGQTSETEIEAFNINSLCIPPEPYAAENDVTALEQYSSVTDVNNLPTDDVLFSSSLPAIVPAASEMEGEVELPAQSSSIQSFPYSQGSPVVERIETILRTIITDLQDGAEDVFILLRASYEGPRRPTSGLDNLSVPARFRKISFPGSSAGEAWRFTTIVRILELIHESLTENTKLTKRDIYYRHPDLFLKQSVVDRYVDDIARTFEVSRHHLNVVATAKGIVAGNFKIHKADGSMLNGLNEAEGMLVPEISENDAIDMPRIRWILVVEKEATFRSLLATALWAQLSLQGLVLTAKGYPDLSSRRFLSQLAQHCPRVPMYMLVDYDPDGFAIMSTYKYSSHRLSHETISAGDMHPLALPQLRWLDIKCRQMERADTKEGEWIHDWLANVSGLMKLTTRDRNKATQMLGWHACAEDGCEQQWRRELQTMLILNIKAEMQILEELPGGIASWLTHRLVVDGEEHPV